MSIKLKYSLLKSNTGFMFSTYIPITSSLWLHDWTSSIIDLWSAEDTGRVFDKGVECLIPPRYSEVNYRYNNQFHATRQWFYDTGEENGGLHFYLSEL